MYRRDGANVEILADELARATAFCWQLYRDTALGTAEAATWALVSCSASAVGIR